MTPGPATARRVRAGAVALLLCLLAAACEGIPNYYDCSRVVERIQLSNLPDRFARNGDTLLVTLAPGRRLPVVDRDIGGAGTVVFDRTRICRAGEVCRTPATLRRTDGDWVVEEGEP